MGALLSLLSGDCAAPDEYDGSGAGSAYVLPPNCDIFVDFENAAPLQEERNLYDDAEEILNESKLILDSIANYKGAKVLIQGSITQNSDEATWKAWEGLVPLVKQVWTFQQFSKKLEFFLPKIMHELFSYNEEYAKRFTCVAEQLLKLHQALVKQFAKIIEFALLFDEKKMSNSSLQNDFSHFRRVIRLNEARFQYQTLDENSTDPKVKLLNSIKKLKQDFLTDKCQDDISKFLTKPTPMLTSLVSVTSTFVKGSPDQEKDNPCVTITALGVMAKVCQTMMATPKLRSRITNEETQLFVLRVMVGLIILYDHIQPDGAFVKGSAVNIEGCLKVLHDCLSERHPQLKIDLVNALKYTSRHWKDETTPKRTKSKMDKATDIKRIQNA